MRADLSRRRVADDAGRLTRGKPTQSPRRNRWQRCALASGLLLTLGGGCGTALQPAPPAAPVPEGAYYRIGPGDTLQLFVWRNEELSRDLPVRPDGRISVPLLEDVEAAGKTPSALSRDLERRFAEYIRDPVVTVIVSSFAGTFDQQVRVIGEAQKPQAIPYRDKMTLLDVMIAVGGLTEFASGNRAIVNRTSGKKQDQYRVRLDDLIRDGEIDANVEMYPGDVLIIPRRYL